jgi:vancomycin permeability regulator SanA
MVCCVLALLPATWMWTSTADRILPVGADGRIGGGTGGGTGGGSGGGSAPAGDTRGTDSTSPPSAPVALVFGAGLWDGEPSPYLAHRLDSAARLYRQHAVRAILVTGDNSTEDYDEPGAMRRYLTARGVPARRIVADYAGFDTWDSCTRAVRVFGVRRALLVSQGFHIRRATALCEAAGLDGYGVRVDEPHDVTWYAGGAREVLSATKAALDASLTPDPQFLGPREPGVRRALSGAGHGRSASGGRS